MSEKALHDFENTDDVSQVQGIKDFELLASKSGENAQNVTLENLRTWVVNKHDSSGVISFNIDDSVNNLNSRVTDTQLILSSSKLTGGSSKWQFEHPPYYLTNKLAVENGEVTFTEVTADKLKKLGSSIALSQGEIVFAAAPPNSSDASTILVVRNPGESGQDVAVTGSLTVSQTVSATGNVTGAKIAAAAAQGFGFGTQDFPRIKSEDNDLSIEINSTGKLKLEDESDVANLVLDAQTTSQIVLKTGSQLSDGGTGLLFTSNLEERTTAPNLKGRLHVDSSRLTLQGANGSIAIQDTGTYGLSTWGQSKITIDANGGGLHLGFATDLHVRSDREIVWRDASTSQRGLMSASDKAQINKIAAIEEANGNLTQNLGYQTITDASGNSRTATSADRILNISGDDNISVVVDTNTANAELSIKAPNVATLAGAETLTNKTITDPTITGGSVEATKLRNQAISSTAPTANQILQYIDGEWTPAAPAAAEDNPSFSDTINNGPSIRFDNDANTGIGRTVGLGNSQLDLFAGSGGARLRVTNEKIQSYEPHRFSEHVEILGPSDGNPLDIRLRGDNTGIAGTDRANQVRINVAGTNVAEFRQNRVVFKGGISRNVKRAISNQKLSPQDDVVFASGNCEAISLPTALESTGQVVTICAVSGKGGTVSAGLPAATRVQIIGYGDTGSRDPVDGLETGIEIAANESAMLVCDGEKWIRIGRVGGSSGSTPAVDTTWSAFAINFMEGASGVYEPTKLSWFGDVNVKHANDAPRNVTDLAITSVDGVDTKLSASLYNSYYRISGNYVGIKERDTAHYPYMTPNEAISTAMDSIVLEVKQLPAGNYQCFYMSGFHIYQYYPCRVLVTKKNNSSTNTGGVWKAHLSISNSAAKNYKKMWRVGMNGNQQVEDIIAQGGPTVSGSSHQTYPFQDFKEGRFTAGVTHGESEEFTVSETQDVLFHFVPVDGDTNRKPQYTMPNFFILKKV